VIIRRRPGTHLHDTGLHLQSLGHGREAALSIVQNLILLSPDPNCPDGEDHSGLRLANLDARSIASDYGDELFRRIDGAALQSGREYGTADFESLVRISIVDSHFYKRDWSWVEL